MSSKVVTIMDGLIFDDETRLESWHNQDCCEHHWLDFNHLTLQDFEGLLFDLSGDKFFEKVEDYGIRLVPLNGHPVSIPGYGYNNGYYSHDLSILVTSPDGVKRYFDISDCQTIDY